MNVKLLKFFRTASFTFEKITKSEINYIWIFQNYYLTCVLALDLKEDVVNKFLVLFVSRSLNLKLAFVDTH